MARGNEDGSEQESLRQYLNDIGQYALLTRDDEVRLAIAIEAGKQAAAQLKRGGTDLTGVDKRRLRNLAREGEEAEQAFVQSNLHLVVSIAEKYKDLGLPLLDLIQEGNLGLLQAVERFDWRKGLEFSTVATWWIREAITEGIEKTGHAIRLPDEVLETLARLPEVHSRLTAELGRRPTLSELARDVKLSEYELLELLDQSAEPLSLATPVGGETLADVLVEGSSASPFEEAATALLPEEIARLLAPLDEREREILMLRFGLDRGKPRTLEEVGKHFNLTRERIRQIEEKALKKLRHPSSDTGARDILAV